MKKLLSILLTLLMTATTITALPFTVHAQVYSGVFGYGSDINYSLDTETGVLNITGTGELDRQISSRLGDFVDEHDNQITSVVIGEGITYISGYQITRAHYATKVTIPVSLERIGSSAFRYCHALTDIYYAGTKAQLASIKITHGLDERDNEYHFEHATCHCSNYTGPYTTTYSGSCGTNVKYEVNTEVGFVSVSGTGAMTDYTTMNYREYYDSSRRITSVYIASGVTSIGSYAFAGLSNVKTVCIPSSVTSINDSAFADCDALGMVYYEGSLSDWNEISIGSKNAKLTEADRDYGYKCGTSGATAYSLNPNGYLTISGNGNMADYENESDSPFSGNAAIKKITFENGVTGIGDNAFRGCTGLKEVVFKGDAPSRDVTSIGDSAFMYCSSLEEIKLPNYLENVKDMAFAYCGLKEITVPANVTHLGTGAFMQNNALERVEIRSKNLTAIYPETFDHCTNLRYVNMRTGAEDIYYNAFRNCLALESISLPKTVTKIREDAFLNCVSLSKVYYEGTFDEWGSIDITENGNSMLTNAELNCQTLKGFWGTNANYSMDFATGTFTISGTGALADYARYFPWDDYRSSIYTLVVGEGITAIPQELFANHTKITEVILPASLKSIGNSAFFYDYSITDYYYSGSSSDWNKITIDGGNGYLINATPHYNYNSSTYDPNIVTDSCGNNLTCSYNKTTGELTISGTGAMYDYNSKSAPWKEYKNDIKTVVVKNGVTSIGKEAFWICTGITSVTLGNTVTSIGDYAFNGCENLAEINLPESLTYIGTQEFSETAITTIEIPNGVKEIKGSTFNNCKSLTTVTIPKSVTSIGGYAFYGCDALADVYYSGNESEWGAISIGSGNTVLNSAEKHFAGANPQTVFTGSCGENVSYSFDSESGILTVSGSGAMADYSEDYPGYYASGSSITSIVVEEGVSYIGKYAFYYLNNLQTVNIPVSVTQIGNSAFRKCDALTDVYYAGSQPQWSAMTIAELGNESLTQSSTVHFAVIDPNVFMGKCGENVSYSCNTETGVLTISGEGEMADFNTGHPGYYDYKNEITSIVINEGVTYICRFAFEEQKNVTSVSIPVSVTSIGKVAFKDLTALGGVNYAGTKEQWKAINIDSGNETLSNVTIHCSDGDIAPIVYTGSCGENVSYSLNPRSGVLTISGSGAIADYSEDYPEYFTYRNKITSIVVEEGVSYIGIYAFDNLEEVKTVNLPVSVTEIGKRAFSECDALTDVYYAGSQTQWSAIAIDDLGNDLLTGATIHYAAAECDHSYSSVVTKPTCTEQGYTTYTCTECGDSYVGDYTDALGHTPAASVKENEKAATCTKAGSYDEVVKCSICGVEISKTQKTVNALGHSYKATTTKATLTKNGSIVKKCSRCGASGGTTIYYPKTIALSATSYTYDGKVKKPTVSVKDSAGKTIAASNYTVTYASGCKNVGAYTVKVAFKGNYSGTKSFTFKINPKATTVSKLTSPKTKQLKVTWKKQATQTTGYEIQIATDAKFTKNKKSYTVAKNGTTSKTITGLKAKTKYYVRIRTYKTVGKTKYYSAWSAAKNLKVK